MSDDNDSQFSFPLAWVFLAPYYFAYYVIPQLLGYAVAWIQEQLGID